MIINEILAGDLIGNWGIFTKGRMGMTIYWEDNGNHPAVLSSGAIVRSWAIGVGYLMGIVMAISWEYNGNTMGIIKNVNDGISPTIISSGATMRI